MYQQITIAGNLGRDPELKYIGDGKAVCDFSVAVAGWQDSTTWFKVTAWGKLAEVCNEYLHKGKQVLVVGEVKASAYLGKDGEAKASLEITAREVKFLGSKSDSTSPSSGFEEEDMPF